MCAVRQQLVQQHWRAVQEQQQQQPNGSRTERTRESFELKFLRFYIRIDLMEKFAPEVGSIMLKEHRREKKHMKKKLKGKAAHYLNLNGQTCSPV